MSPLFYLNRKIPGRTAHACCPSFSVREKRGCCLLAYWKEALLRGMEGEGCCSSDTCCSFPFSGCLCLETIAVVGVAGNFFQQGLGTSSSKGRNGEGWVGSPAFLFLGFLRPLPLLLPLGCGRPEDEPASVLCYCFCFAQSTWPVISRFLKLQISNLRTNRSILPGKSPLQGLEK